MEISRTKIDGCFAMVPKVFHDERGHFFESFNQRTFNQETGLDINFVQDNQSFSQKGVLRGLHYQKGSSAQAKLVRVLEGEVLDVVVDIRPGSDTYGAVFSILLSAKNNKQLFVPRGCAHGFVTLSDRASFFYKCDNYYDPKAETGILYNDERFGIDWMLPEESLIISEKDRVLPKFTDLVNH
ncbi:dTDP-4-dehydrorhamnose 3,5-epimerase [Maribacter sp. 2307ULW6-5]|uniref:dTDP-4-dehydrorhamnose 3,5-epimerase n=1 Tax=Maribacter sp. 2307ULW6-5 TaxID=3386275 RepID=UPI0039BD0550